MSRPEAEFKRQSIPRGYSWGMFFFTVKLKSEFKRPSPGNVHIPREHDDVYKFLYTRAFVKNFTCIFFRQT